MESMNMEVSPIPNGRGQNPRCGVSNFQLPVNYPRYTKAEYETMPEWKLNRLFTEYGLLVTGNLEQKRNSAIGAFLWPNYSEQNGLGGRPLANGQVQKDRGGNHNNFRMPLNYPRYSKANYEMMPEWKLDYLFFEYGLPKTGNLAQKRSFTMGAFLWPRF